MYCIDIENYPKIMILIATPGLPLFIMYSVHYEVTFAQRRTCDAYTKQVNVCFINHYGNISVQKVTPDFHLTYSKNGGNLGSESK